MFPDGTQKVVADLADSNLAPALDGVDAVFLLTDRLNIAAHDHRLVAAARLAAWSGSSSCPCSPLDTAPPTRSPPCTEPARRLRG